MCTTHCVGRTQKVWKVKTWKVVLSDKHLFHRTFFAEFFITIYMLMMWQAQSVLIYLFVFEGSFRPVKGYLENQCLQLFYVWSMLITAKRQAVEYFSVFGQSWFLSAFAIFQSARWQGYSISLPSRKKDRVALHCKRGGSDKLLECIFVSNQYNCVGCDTAKWILRCVPCINQPLIYFWSFCWV